jgi:mono/diheme cytochrome c family protein
MEHHSRKIIALAIFAIMLIGLSSCYYDNKEELYPASANCETDNMSYANDVWPVINASCVGCHGGAAPAGDIPLENYTDVAAAAAINPGNYGSLYGAISHASGNSPMPKGSNKLSDCTVTKIKAWIDQGAQDN